MAGIFECYAALGMENGTIPDKEISASTELGGHLAVQGRLHFKSANVAGSWSAAKNDDNQWLQIGMGNRLANITGVATQGRDGYSQWVTKYNLQYGDDGVNFNYYMEHGLSAIKVKYSGTQLVRTPNLNILKRAKTRK